MITISNMHPGRSKKSGRRYFRGRLKDGGQIWLIEDTNKLGWTLKLDPVSLRATTIDLAGVRLVGSTDRLLITDGDA